MSGHHPWREVKASRATRELSGMDIPARLVHFEESGRAVVYLHDIPELVACHLEHLAGHIDLDIVPMPGAVVRGLLLGEAEGLRGGVA